MIAISGQIDTKRALTFTHQVVDQHAIFSPVAKYVADVAPNTVGHVMRKALRVSTAPRPGPVHLSTPADHIGADALDCEVTLPPSRVSYQAVTVIGDGLVSNRLKKAIRPLILSGALNPSDVVRVASGVVDSDAIATTDVGSHKLLVGQGWHPTAPRRLLMTNGLSSMGFSLPAAIAAKIFDREREVVCFTGDGGLAMVQSELRLAASLGLGIKVVVFLDQSLNRIELKQMARQFPSTGTLIEETDTIMTAEAGFPIKDANGEINRALQTLALAADEAKRLSGEVVPFSGAPTGGGRIGFTVPAPLGIVVAIMPFNAPLNTVCHKVGPAIAAGNAVILKPSDKTPLTANLLAQCFCDAGAQSGTLAVLHGGIPVAQALLADHRPNFFAFTGSTQAGRAIQMAAGLRRTQMELGSISATIVLDDADIPMSAKKCAGASFRKAGQVCTSIQMLMVSEQVLPELRDAFLEAVDALVVGDPADPETDVGPMKSVAAAERVSALLKGQPLLRGGKCDRALLQPTVVDAPSAASDVLTQEIFGPVACLIPIRDIDDAVTPVNATPYGLATGLFTNGLQCAITAATRLDVGGVHINETSSSRVDLMPYGGTKESGFGHEGPKYAVREMMPHKLITFSGLPV